MATCVMLLYALKNIIWLSEATVGCWAHHLMGRDGREESGAERRGEWIPYGRVGRALRWPIYITATGLCLVTSGPLLEYFSPWLYLLMEVSNSCSLHVTISNVPWWSLSWCIHLLEFNLNVGYNFSGLVSKLKDLWQELVDSHHCRSLNLC